MRFFGFLVFLGGTAMAVAFYHGDELGLSKWAGMGENQFLAVFLGILVAACGLLMIFTGKPERGPSGFTPPAVQRRPRRW